jgi:hypothetical protein
MLGATVALAALAATAASGQAVGGAAVVAVQVTGDPAARFSMVILGDGYTAAELPRFRAHVDKHLNVLWSIEPWRSYRSYINVYAVEIVSGESGITCDPAHREERSTPLGMAFGGGCDNPNARGIRVDQDAAREYATRATPAYDQILSIANTDTYGGIGGRTATTSGGNSLGPLITPHELGHSLGRLSDEYTYGGRGRPGGTYEGDEPNSIHHTLLSEEQMRAQQRKWWRWLREPSLAGGTIGLYEGGQGNTAGIWRPSKHSMMISLGYYYDQVGLERMTERISGQVELIAASTPTASPVHPRQVVWIETPHPVYHELDVTWRVDGDVVANPDNHRHLDLERLALSAGEHTVAVTVVDPTEFVRDAAIRDSALTATRSWTVSPAATLPTTPVRAAFTASAQTSRPVGGTDVVHVETSHPADRVPAVIWRLDGRMVPGTDDRRTFRLADHDLAPGTHTLSATVADSAGAAGGETLTWTVDNTEPVIEHTLSAPVTSIVREDGSRHYFQRDEFTMKLDPSDDQPGYVVAEFRVNGDGWHHYYGWPDSPPGTPFLFTPRGTNIKELIYGSLSSEGLSPQPWEAREPGWGTHRIEYRAIDAAGNIGTAKEFHVTILPSAACTTTVTGRHAGALAVQSGVTCIDGAEVQGPVTVAAGASLVATNASIAGPVTGTGAATIELIATTVGGDVRLAGTTGGLTLFGSTFERDVCVLTDSHTAAPTLTGNTVRGALTCPGNSLLPNELDVPRTVGGAAWQLLDRL